MGKSSGTTGQKNICIEISNSGPCPGDPDEIRLAGERLTDHVHIRAHLPGLLARAAMAGHREECLAALIAWGTGQIPISRIWEEMQRLVDQQAGE